MLKIINDWMQRYFSDEEAVVLAVMLALGFTVILTLGGMLAPVLIALVLAFLLQGVVGFLERRKVPHVIAVWSVFAVFMTLLTVFLLVVLPLTGRQLTTLFNELPRMTAELQAQLLLLPNVTQPCSPKTKCSAP